MIYEKRYDNGLRLVVKRMPGILSVTMGILVGTGASVESAQEDGISHFIEHMQFKGTTNATHSRSPTPSIKSAHRSTLLREKIVPATMQSRLTTIRRRLLRR